MSTEQTDTQDTWTQADAIALCVEIEAIASRHGAHVGLTGGLLYKSGPRKDCDIVLYRHKRTKPIDHEGLFGDLRALGIVQESGFGYFHKADMRGKRIDFFSPQEEGRSPGDYPE